MNPVPMTRTEWFERHTAKYGKCTCTAEQCYPDAACRFCCMWSAAWPCPAAPEFPAWVES